MRLALIAPGGLARARLRFLFTALLYRPFGMWGVRRMTEVVFSPVPPPPGAAESFARALRTYRPRTDNLPLVTDEELLALSCPILFLGGDRDALLNTEAGVRRLRRLLPGAEVNVIRGAGHGRPVPRLPAAASGRPLARRRERGAAGGNQSLGRTRWPLWVSSVR